MIDAKISHTNYQLKYELLKHSEVLDATEKYT